jgi:predicted nucleic acid-binding protein
VIHLDTTFLVDLLRESRQAVSTMDLLIATAARLADARLVTRNVRDFERVPGLHVLTY